LSARRILLSASSDQATYRRCYAQDLELRRPAFHPRLFAPQSAGDHPGLLPADQTFLDACKLGPDFLHPGDVIVSIGGAVDLVGTLHEARKVILHPKELVDRIIVLAKLISRSQIRSCEPRKDIIRKSFLTRQRSPIVTFQDANVLLHFSDVTIYGTL
jgi:hypothetical protein